MPNISETCVYTIAHTKVLAKAYADGGVATFHEGRRWATARKWLTAARETGSRIPVVFAAAEDTTDLIYFGWLEDVLLGVSPATTFRVVGLTPFRKPLHRKTSLFVAETGQPIPAAHIRPYVLCRTPQFLYALDPPNLDTATAGTLTLFSWGYWGWGSATSELIQAVDAAESLRGFGAPMFVDIRIRRSVRAMGFTGNAFEKTIGRDRYRWIQDLGNESVLAGGGPTRIRNPKAASQLLELAVEASARRQRLLFFCACEFPESPDAQCHRVDVAELVLAEAKRRGMTLSIQEWPGGEPSETRIEVEDKELKRVLRGAPSVRIDSRLDLGLAASTPWGSRLILNGGDHEKMLTGPVKRNAHRWVLPIIRGVESDRFRRKYGYIARLSVASP